MDEGMIRFRESELWTITMVKPIPQHPYAERASTLERQAWILLVGEGIAQPTCEFKFHPERQWRLDFAWPLEKVGLEIEGGIWVLGRHNRPAAFTKDCEKYSVATTMGWRILRATADQLNRNDVVHWVKTTLEYAAQGKPPLIKAQCCRCDQPYSPASGRRPRWDRPNYCPDCRHEIQKERMRKNWQERGTQYRQNRREKLARKE